jgi:hypothetical protein
MEGSAGDARHGRAGGGAVRASILALGLLGALLLVPGAAVAAPPDNDTRAGATPITSTASGINVDATTDGDDPAGAGAHTVWYRVEMPGGWGLHADTCGSFFDTVVTLVDSSDSVVAQADDEGDCGGGMAGNLSVLSTGPLAAGTYYLVVGGFPTATPNASYYSLRIGLANDALWGAKDVTAGSTTASSNAGATRETGEPDPSAQPNVTGSVWFRFIAPGTGQATVDTCASGGTLSDSVIGVYTGGSVDTLTEVTSNDDDDTFCAANTYLSRATFNAVAGTIYWISVAGWADTGGNSTGTFTLHTTCCGASSGTPPEILLPGRDSVTDTTVRVAGSVNPHGSPASYRFEYGTTPGYGTQTPLAGAGSGTGNVSGETTLTGLTPNQLYHFRMIAYGTHGVDESDDIFFITDPAPPTFVPTVPNSPANANDIRVVGQAGDLTTVKLYTNSACTGAPVATGTAADFASPGFAVTVADDTTTSFWATATNLGVSTCSPTHAEYTEDSTPPSAVIDSGPDTQITERRPTFTFHASEPGSSYQCALDRVGIAPLSPCGSGATGSFTPAAPLSDGSYVFRVRATDPAGNAQADPAMRQFAIATPPATTTEPPPTAPPAAEDDPPAQPGGQAIPPPSNAFSLGKPKLNRKAGTATEPVTLPGPGELDLTGKGVAEQHRTAAGAGELDLRVKPKGKAKRRLKRKGKAKVRITVTFTPTGGTANTATAKVKLRKRARRS